MKNILIFVASLTLIGTAFGQDTAGVNTTTTSGAVIKGLAPVAKELLKVRFPKPKFFKLTNGISVYVLEDHRIPTVRLSLELKAGSLLEPKPGVAAATAALLTEGTTTRDSLKIADDAEAIGANVVASSGLDSTTVSASGLSEALEPLIALMTDTLLNPSYPADRVDRFKFSQRSGLAQRRSNPAQLVAEMTDQMFYGGTRYARVAPTAKDVASITSEDLKAFHDAYYQPDGAILGVTGDVDVKTLKAKLEQALSTWKPSHRELSLPPANFVPKSESHVLLIDRPGSAQTVLQFGSMAVKQTDPDYIPLTVANRILGGGSSGRLFQNIRERKGFTYGAYSSLSAGKWPGIWGANANVRTEVTEPAVAEFFVEFKRLQDEPVSAAEINNSKRSIIGSFARTLETPDGILARTLELVQNDLPLNYWDSYPKKIQAVTAEDIQRVAKKYLGGSNVQLIAVGERSKIETGLAKFGKLTVVDPSKIAETIATLR